MSSYDNIVSICQDFLKSFSQAEEVQHYADSRLSRSSQDRFKFGYFPNSENLSILSSIVDEQSLLDCKLIYDKIFFNGIESVKERHWVMKDHNLIIPFRDVYGKIIALVGRTVLDEDKRKELILPKYKNTSYKKKHHLFGLFEAKRNILASGIAYVVEGQFDCISAHDKGFVNVVALGGSNITFEQFALLLRYTDNIVMLLDNDEAGRIGTEKAKKNYSKWGKIRVGNVPAGFKDLDDFLRCGGEMNDVVIK